MKKDFLHPHFFFIVVILFFAAISIPALYQVTLVWSFTLFFFSLLMGLRFFDALKIIGLTFIFSYSVFLLFLFFPGYEYKTGPKVTILSFTFYKKAFDHAVFSWFRLWAISLFSLSSAKVLNAEVLVKYWMQKNWISRRLGYSLLMGLNSIAGFVSEWKQIALNLKLRGIKSKNPFKRIFPLLVYAFRSSYRGAMAFKARGLNEKKVFYIKNEPISKDYLVVALLLAALFLESYYILTL